MRRRPLLLAAAALAMPATLRAQGNAIRIVVPFPPGGSTDAVARILQPQLTQILGQPVVVDNRGGASGSLGTGLVARSAPDGLTWVLVFDTHAVNQALIPNMGFDTQRDLTPVMLFGTGPMFVNVHKDRPWRSLDQVLAAARARPDSITYGSIGNGSLAHLAMELAQKAGGFRLTHVPYRGGGPLAQAAMAGEVDLPTATQTIFNPHYASGTLIPLAQTGATRSPRFPDLPTLADAGIPGIDARAFWGFLGPAGLPAASVARMEAALRQALAVPEIRDRVSGLGIDLDPQGPEAFGAFIARQMETWGRVVRENNIRPD